METYYEGMSLLDIEGNTEALLALGRYAESIDRGIKTVPIMLCGPPGTGKSASVHLLAKERGWNVVELNASDYRDRESIDRMMLAASQSRTIFGAKNLILLDEVDELAPRFDKDAGSAISALLKSSRNPVIMVANDRWSRSIAFLRGSVDYIEFKKLPSGVVHSILTKFAAKNGLRLEKEVIDIVANRSNGDARSAINDITALSGAPSGTVDIVGLRDRKSAVFDTLDKIFFSNTFTAPAIAASNSDVQPDMLIKWIDENLPKRYTNINDMASAFAVLSEATIFSTRASRVQYYTYWRYMSSLMSSGVALSKSEYPDRTARYTFPQMINELSRTKGGRATDTETAKALQRNIHSGLRRIKENEMRLLAEMARLAIASGAEEQLYDFFATKFGMDGKAVDYLASKA